MSRRAVILVGGKGTRLKPYTMVLPKPLMPIGEFPILEVVVRQLARHGFKHLTMAVNHQAELVKAFFGSGKKWKIKIDYSLEKNPLSTIGPLTLIKNLPSNFLVMNGDILTDLNFKNFYDFHSKEKNLFTISSYTRTHLIDYGLLKTDKNGELSEFEEKPKNKYEVSMGIYMCSREIIKMIPQNKPYGFDNLMHSLLRKNKKVDVKEFKGLWLDIGRQDDYEKAIIIFKKMKSRFLNG